VLPNGVWPRRCGLTSFAHPAIRVWRAEVPHVTARKPFEDMRDAPDRRHEPDGQRSNEQTPLRCGGNDAERAAVTMPSAITSPMVVRTKAALMTLPSTSYLLHLIPGDSTITGTGEARPDARSPAAPTPCQRSGETPSRARVRRTHQGPPATATRPARADSRRHTRGRWRPWYGVDVSPSRRATPRDGAPDRAPRACRLRSQPIDRSSRHTHPRARHAFATRSTAIRYAPSLSDIAP
jgi:hypothetical protein